MCLSGALPEERIFSSSPVRGGRTAADSAHLLVGVGDCAVELRNEGLRAPELPDGVFEQRIGIRKHLSGNRLLDPETLQLQQFGILAAGGKSGGDSLEALRGVETESVRPADGAGQFVAVVEDLLADRAQYVRLGAIESGGQQAAAQHAVA